MGSRSSEQVRQKRKREEIKGNGKLRTGKWTKEEEDLLWEGIDLYGRDKGSNKKIAEFMVSRTSDAVAKKREREEIKRKGNGKLRTGKWTKEEEDLLREGIIQFGHDEGSNEKIAEFMGSRSSEQVRKKICHSQEEERKCCRCKRIGTKTDDGMYCYDCHQKSLEKIHFVPSTNRRFND